jgi:short subunit dehydrogenase-like uncharacterized protein
MNTNRTIAVYGAYGHTGRFVVAELCKRGWTPVLCGRDADKLSALGSQYPDLEKRLASVEDPASLDRTLEGASAVINCAGSFLDTAVPIVEAALRARIHYLDMAAEQQAALGIFERFAGAAKAANVTVIPAMAFYGGLADLLATAALGHWPDADSIEIAVALDSWHPTVGTRLTGARNQARRLVVSNGKLAPLPDPPPSRQWTFTPPFATQEMVELPLSEIITISRHVRSTEVHSYMNLAPLEDLRDPDTPAPKASDTQGRSSQIFVVDAIVRRGGVTRRVTAHGQDIYAISAPLVVEAMERVRDGRCSATGAIAPGAAFDARNFLESLPELHLAFADA